MSSGAETSESLRDVKQLLERITRHCGKIPVSKKGAPRLADLCETLSNRLNDRSLIRQQPNCDDIKSELVSIEGRLASQSKYNYMMKWWRRKDIRADIIGFVEKLEFIIARYPAIQPTPISSPGNQGVNPPDRGSLRGIPPREGAGEDTAPAVAGIHRNFRELLRRRTAEPETQDSQLVEANTASPVKQLDGEVTRLGEVALAGGMYCEVWIGRWEKGGGEKTDVEKVALKALRTLKSPERARKRLEQKLPSWAELRHQNILPFYGIVTDIAPRLYMVSPWQENGNLLVYVRRNRQPDKNYLLRGSAAGLNYLHSQGVVHGSGKSDTDLATMHDLISYTVRCNNVLISREGEPQICDFGIAAIAEEFSESDASRSITIEDNVRYLALELIMNNSTSATTYSDTYSFAMLIIECITEEVPFSHLSRIAAVIHARITRGQCPPRPDGDREGRVSDDLWDLMTRCWAVEPDHRPTMQHLVSRTGFGFGDLRETNLYLEEDGGCQVLLIDFGGVGRDGMDKYSACLNPAAGSGLDRWQEIDKHNAAGQIALAWVLAQGETLSISLVPPNFRYPDFATPETTTKTMLSLQNLKENVEAGKINLSTEDVQAFKGVADKANAAQGGRYPEAYANPLLANTPLL
ncbi:kinase-like protein [Thelephora ganbajun]|uniref:Kinase-like protein n=1 Tax=Thelephora ganbajun TaxID=370292 RepID=A0ACB6ZJ02_THEGA|nr:kinase-like protein [Thelephora ganbajun]